MRLASFSNVADDWWRLRRLEDPGAAAKDVAAQLAGREPPPPNEDPAEAEALSADELALWRE